MRLNVGSRSCLIRSMHERVLRFLVIDDEPRAGAMISELLRDLGHSCVVESRGTAALTRAAELMPDVVLTELVLPDITGFDLARELRSKFGGSLVLVATTNWETRGDRERAAAAGFDAYLEKPANPARLQRLVLAAEANHPN
jgi:CheY-like chemotaxis protein